MPAFTRRSLGYARQRLARMLQSLTLVRTTSAGAAGGTSIISAELAGGFDPDLYYGGWVMPVNSAADPGALANQVRRVPSTALATVSGELTVAPAYSGQVPTGVDVEIHSLMPPVERDRMPGLRECINLALSELWFPQRLSLTGVDGQTDYALSAYTDWLDPSAVIAFRAPSVGTGLTPELMGGWEVVRDASNLYLQVRGGLAGGTVYSAEAYRPGDTFIAVNGVWGDSDTGLVNDTDESLFQPNFLAEIALAVALEALANSGAEDASRWARRAQQQRLTANWLKLRYLSHRDRERAAGPSSVDPKASWPGALI